MVDDWGDFDDLEMYTREMLEDQVEEEQQAAVEIFMDAITQPTSNQEREKGKTPVLTGKLMANTHISVGSPSDASYEAFDESGDLTYNSEIMAASRVPAYSKIYIQNNTEDEDGNRYSLKADYKGWKQTPAYEFFTRSVFTLMHDMEDRNR